MVSPSGGGGGTPNATGPNGLNVTSIINADSSVVSSIDDEEEIPLKIKKKDDGGGVKKETTSKTPFYNNFELYRRDSENPSINIPGSQGTPTAQNFGRTGNHFGGRGGRFNASNAAANQPVVQPEPSGPYFPGYYKQQQEFYGKHDVEFANQSPKIVGSHDFHPQSAQSAASHKQEFNHHIKSDFHYMKANEFNQKMQHEFHHIKNHNFHHQPHQNHLYYAAAAANHHQDIVGAPGTGVGTAAALQYQNQYYHNNEYDPGQIDQTAYYEAKSQGHYYDNLNYHPANEYGGGGGGGGAPHGATTHPGDPAYMTPPANNLSESCDNFGFPQYYEGPPGVVNSIGGAHPNVTNNHGSGGIPHNHLQNPTGFVHQAVQPSFPNANVPGGLGNGAPINNNPEANIVGMENSNSSSDFNFLSNLANDFAPEYYQLS